MFKDFVIRKLPSGAFQNGEICVAGVQAMGVTFTGIETARAFEAHDFDGTTLQGAGKAGQFVSKDNKKALVKVTATVTGGRLCCYDLAWTAAALWAWWKNNSVTEAAIEADAIKDIGILADI